MKCFLWLSSSHIRRYFFLLSIRFILSFDIFYFYSRVWFFFLLRSGFRLLLLVCIHITHAHTYMWTYRNSIVLVTYTRISRQCGAACSPFSFYLWSFNIFSLSLLDSPARIGELESNFILRSLFSYVYIYISFIDKSIWNDGNECAARRQWWWSSIVWFFFCFSLRYGSCLYLFVQMRDSSYSMDYVSCVCVCDCLWDGIRYETLFSFFRQNVYYMCRGVHFDLCRRPLTVEPHISFDCMRVYNLLPIDRIGFDEFWFRIDRFEYFSFFIHLC